MSNVSMRVLHLFRYGLAAILVFAGCYLAAAQTSSDSTQTAAQSENEQAEEQLLSEAEIDQLLAPIALYPDALLSQVMMAATYPLEVVEAARWVENNPDVKDQALQDAMDQQPWDPSVASLTAFPTVLAMMNEQLSWTQQLGDAFLAQEEDVLEGVQRLRKQAQEAGTLETTEQQVVSEQTYTLDSGGTSSAIVIEPANPEVVYVPAYDPTVVYGTWRYPAYRPYYWYPPGYVAGNVFWFGAGLAVGNALWGGYDWGHYNVHININRYNNYHRHHHRNDSNWHHDRNHRKGVPYKNRRTAERHGNPRRDVRTRDQFRGRDGNRRDVANRAPDRRPANAQRDRQQQGANRPQAKRPPAKKQPAAKRPQAKRQPAAYKGINNGKQVKKQSARGAKSRNAKRAKSAPPRRKGGHGGGRRR